MAAISIEHLKKNYGKHTGVRDVSFSVEAGEIYGFVGPNGAGKTTTIKALMGFIMPTDGSASVCGLDAAADSKKIKAFTGYVPSEVRLYPHMKVGELLRRNAGFYKGDCARETERLTALFEVDSQKKFRELSSGNKKKVSIVCALMAKPRVIILDEPTNGLDPVMQRNLFEELKRQAGQGVTVLLSSHHLAEVEEYCRRAAFIKDGEIIAVTDLRESAGPRKIVTVSGASGRAPEGLEEIKEEEKHRTFRTKLTGGALLEAIGALGPDDFTVQNETVEERFFSLYGLEGKQ